jgi:hypothetical protein
VTYLRELVETPRPLPAQFGIVNKHTLVHDPADSHWENGFTYEVTAGSVYAQTHDVCDYTKTGHSIGNAPGSAGAANNTYFLNYSPFEIEATDGCRTSIGLSVEDRKARAAAALELVTAKAIEQEFWDNAFTSGANSNGNRSLTNQTPIEPRGATAVPLRQGIAALELALAGEGAGVQGAIHVTRDVLSMLRVDMAGIQDEDGVVYSPGGHMLIGGSGYSGNGPTARTATTAWAFATGPIAVRMSPVRVNDVPSHVTGPAGVESFSTNNTLVFTAERFAAVTFNGVNTYAVLIDLTL